MELKCTLGFGSRSRHFGCALMNFPVMCQVFEQVSSKYAIGRRFSAAVDLRAGVIISAEDFPGQRF